LPQRWIAPQFPIKAAELMARGVEKGPRLGEALAAAEKAWIAAGFPSQKSEVDAIAEAAARG
jgi:poly(A) polymerase